MCENNLYKKHIRDSSGKFFKTREYQFWTGMLYRAESDNYKSRCSTYITCSVSKNFKNFQYFAEWCNNQIGFCNKGWELDKDILIRGNKEYSENTSVFVPKQLNMLLVKKDNASGLYSVGVSYVEERKKFISCIREFGKSRTIGLFDTEKEAFDAYKIRKQNYIKEVVNLYKDEIDPRVYEVLINYEVSDYD